MQNARIQVLSIFEAADMDQTGILEILGKDLHDTRERVDVERVEHFVRNDPARCLQNDARERETLLFLLAQFALPSARLIEHRRQSLEAQPRERVDEGP